MIRINTTALVTIVMAVIIAKDLVEQVGKTQTIKTEPYKWYESLFVGVFIIIIFLLGKYSKFKREE